MNICRNHPLSGFSSKGVKRYWADSICTNTSSLTLTFDLFSSKSIGVIHFLGAPTVPSLATFQQGDKRYWADNIFSKTSSLTWPLTMRPKINWGRLLPSYRGIHCTKFGIVQAKGSKDIERTSLDLQIERPIGQDNMPPFFSKGERGIKMPLCKIRLPNER